MPSAKASALAAEMMSMSRATAQAEEQISPMASKLVKDLLPPVFTPAPTVFYDENKQASGAAATAAGVATDPQRAMEIFAKYRNKPVSDYEIIDGEIAYRAEDGKYYAEVPGFLTSPGQKLQYIAPDIAETAVGVASRAIPASTR
jgi:hypothetical protein